jgi:Secretion system C-terminal sorting domain
MKKILIMLIVVCSFQAISQTQCLTVKVDGSNKVSFNLTADAGTFMLQTAQIYFTSTQKIDVGTVVNSLGSNYFANCTDQGSNSYYFSVVSLAPSQTIGASPVNLGTVSFDGTIGTVTKTSSAVFKPAVPGPGGEAVMQTATCDAVLPTELITFKGNKKGTVSQLQWEATNEKNLVNYIVERSTDGRNFRPLGFTKPKSFNATEKVAYDFIDDSPEIGINYYRLLSKGLGKDEKYSKVISLDFGLGLSGKVFPNPLDSDLTIELDIEDNTGNVDISIYDVVGKQILNKKIQNSDRRVNMTLPTADLPPGSYLVKVKVGTFNWERQITKM